MPSRPLSPHAQRAHKAHALLVVSAVAGAAILLVAVLLLFVYLNFFLHRRSPPATLHLRRFRHRDLRRATASFHPSRRLGRGASASVLRALLLPGPLAGAVKLFDPSPSSETPFSNELHVLSSIPPSPFVVPLLGYCLEGRRRHRRRALVFEFMPNGSLQDALLTSSAPVVSWSRRFSIILDVAKALAFLHLDCDPPVIHGDIKPSNVLLDADFRAKISDFGLARFKMDGAGDAAPDLFSQELLPSQELWKCHELASPEPDFAFAPPAPSSKKAHNAGARDDKGKETAAVAPCDEEFGKESAGGQEWWWKQDGGGELSSRDYVREWIGSQIPSSNPDWVDDRKSSPEKPSDLGYETFFKPPNSTNPDSKSNNSKKKVREWWKEEYFAEIIKKSSCRNRGLRPMSWLRAHSCRGGAGCEDGDLNIDISFRKGWKRKRSRSASSELFSGDLFSKELSSTTSMRGTVCYVAPEYGAAEKGDIYSFGVLALVIVSGRRPLHVMSSPMRLEKANLVSYCRQLAQGGNVLEVVDERLREEYDRQQASLCINLAMLCLQRSPELRPDAGDVVKMLKGETELPVVPAESSPSPRSYSRSRRRSVVDKD